MTEEKIALHSETQGHPSSSGHLIREMLEWGRGSSDSDEFDFLHSRRSRTSEALRALRIFAECIRGFRALHFVGPCATVYGSARFTEDHPYYVQTRELGRQLAKAGFTVMTGGGPGLMEAANRGAKDVGGRSVGCNIILPMEQRPNPYLDRWVEFRYFFVRKLMLAKYSLGFVAAPGGFGTLDEFFEIATLIQTGKLQDFPLILYGSHYWSPLVGVMRDVLLRCKTIDAGDYDRIIVSDSPEQIVTTINRYARAHRERSSGKEIRKSRFLLER